MKASEFKAKHGSNWQAELRKLKANESQRSDFKDESISPPIAMGGRVNPIAKSGRAGFSAASAVQFLERCDACEHRIERSDALPNGHCEEILRRTHKECDAGFMGWIVNGRCPLERFSTTATATTPLR